MASCAKEGCLNKSHNNSVRQAMLTLSLSVASVNPECNGVTTG